MAIVRFHFDFISPYAYLAWTQISALAERCGASVEPTPVLFAALLNHHGQKGPAEIPAKRRYVFKDVLRRGALLGVPIAPPPTHPFNPLLALRTVLVAPAERQRALIDALFAATWGRARVKGLERPETVAAAAEEAGVAAPPLLERAGSQEAKDALRRVTDHAIAVGVFGVPTMVVDGELFWGLDSLDLLERHLGGEDSITPEVLAGLLDVSASAQR
jgi:2-hydroxychromene-2-carboxylate isomerase